MPIVKPVALIVSVPPLAVASAQVIFVPVQAPERKSTTGSNEDNPTTCIVGVAEVATNLYHTSSSDVPAHGAAAIDKVAPTVVPLVGLHVVVCVNVVALAHRSFAGAEEDGPNTQMVKDPCELDVEP